MKGLDTNILLRYLTQDDPDQFTRARRIFDHAENSGESLRINAIVLCELVWVLRGGSYRLGREELAATLEMLLETSILEIEHRDQVREALSDFRIGEGDFPDYLIGQLNASAGCGKTWSFDRKLEGSELFGLPPS